MNAAITPAPRGGRPVPWSTQLVVGLGRGSARAGFCIFAFGMIFVWVFGTQGDWSAWRFRGPLETAPAHITAIERTNFSEGGDDHSSGTHIYRSLYKFQQNGVEHTGTSYRTGRSGQPGELAMVEFPVGHPELSRLRGQRRAPFGMIILLVFLVPAVGLGVAWTGVRCGTRDRRLLRHGTLTRAKLLGQEATNTSINDQRVYRLTFQYTDDLDRPHTLTVKTEKTAHLTDDAEEFLLYDPARPARATLLDDFPVPIRLQDNGRVTACGLGKTIAALIPPLLALLAVVVGAVIKFVA